MKSLLLSEHSNYPYSAGPAVNESIFAFWRTNYSQQRLLHTHRIPYAIAYTMTVRNCSRHHHSTPFRTLRSRFCTPYLPGDLASQIHSRPAVDKASDFRRLRLRELDTVRVRRENIERHGYLTSNFPFAHANAS
jgi:hypothetical protein